MPRSLIVEADGGSRGNPGPAGYGAVVRDAASGEVLAELYQSLGVTTNNVAEYSGLVAGLTAAAELAPGADVDVALDSKLVVEQMSGRWQIKHPALRPLAAQAEAAARRLGRVSYQWVPRARNAHADRLANRAMDEAGDDDGEAGQRGNGSRSGAGVSAAAPSQPAAAARPGPSWTGAQPEPLTTVLLRHGETPLSAERRFAGRGDIPLTEAGRPPGAGSTGSSPPRCSGPGGPRPRWRRPPGRPSRWTTAGWRPTSGSGRASASPRP